MTAEPAPQGQGATPTEDGASRSETDASAPAARFQGYGRGTITDTSELITVDRYRELTLETIEPLDPIDMKVTDALGLVLARDIVAREAVPSFANSAMDGYAVAADDVASATEDSPAELRVIGEIPAGVQSLPTVERGTAARIMTGAPLPPGADTVVPVEVTRERNARLTVHRPSRVGEFVRTIGQDVAPGQTLLTAGRRLRPADIGLLAAIGQARVSVHPTPRVVIFSTGDELVPSDRAPAAGQIRDSNGPMLAALVRQAAATPFAAGIIRDDRKSLMDAFDSNLGHADLFVVTGGVSVGAYDHVADVVASLGEATSYKLAMKPGMPQVFGRIDGTPVFALPGNPVSSYVSFEMFVRPSIRAMQGRSDRFRPRVEAVLTRDLTSPPAKRSFIRVQLENRDWRWHATPTGDQGSHILTSISEADGLAEVPEDTQRLSAGAFVTVHLLVEAT